MEFMRYKVLPTGGSLLSAHYKSLSSACNAAKDMVRTHGYTSARIVIRISEIELACVRKNEVQFANLDEMIAWSVVHCKDVSGYFRYRAKNQTDAELKETHMASAEVWDLRAHMVGPELLAQSHLCHRYLG